MYGNNVPVHESCPSKEEIVVNLKKQVGIDQQLVNAMDIFADHHGAYALNDLNLFQAYGNLSHAIKENTKEIDKLIAELENV